MKKHLVLLCFALVCFSCGDEKNTEEKPVMTEESEEKAFREAARLMQEMKTGEALEVLQKIEREGSQRERALFGIGSCYLMQHEPQKALEAYEKALNSDPEYYEAMIGAGSACLDLKRYEDALNYFRQARRSNPRIADSYRGLAIAFDRLNRGDSVMVNVKITLEKDPDARQDYDLQQLMKKYGE